MISLAEARFQEAEDNVWLVSIALSKRSTAITDSFRTQLRTEPAYFARAIQDHQETSMFQILDSIGQAHPALGSSMEYLYVLEALMKSSYNSLAVSCSLSSMIFIAF